MHVEFNGLSFTPNSLQTQASETYAVPMFGAFVVNEKFDISAFKREAALNRVVFPALVLPTMPIFNRQRTP